MAHFAQINNNNEVICVMVVDDSELLDNDGNETEAKGIEFCQNLFPNTRWVQTSYSAEFRKNYAGVGMIYDADRDAFLFRQPFAGWQLNEDTCQWQPQD
jgi:hypothetical protein